MPNEIFISQETHAKLSAYAEIAKKTLDSEIGGYLLIKELDEGGLLIEDILLPEQTVSGGSFKAKPGLKCDPEVIPKIHGWWHSHHNMGTFHSGTDNDTLADKWNGETKGSPHYAVSVVVALPLEIKAYLQYFRPVVLEKVEIPVNIIHTVSKEIYEKCEAEVKKNVAKETYSMYGTGGFNVTDRGELPDKEETEAIQPFFLSKEIEEDIELEAESSIIDPTTGFSVSQLKEQGMWSPKTYDSDLVHQVESMKRILREKYAKIIGKNIQLKLGECPHISLNEHNRPICFLNGRNYDCSKCSRRLKPTESKEEKDEPKPIIPVEDVTPSQPQQPQDEHDGHSVMCTWRSSLFKNREVSQPSS